MTTVTVRELKPGPSGNWTISTRSHVFQPVWIVWWTLASKCRGQRRSTSTAIERLSAFAEIQTMLTHLITIPGQPLRWHPGWHAGATPQTRRYLTETIGQALTNDLAQSLGWDPLVHSMGWFDDPATLLPLGTRHLKPRGPGPRPDVLVETSTGWHTLESRGRTAPAPVRSVPNSDERKRLADLAVWSTGASLRGGSCPWSMFYSWIGTTGVIVDFFDPGEPLDVSEEDSASARVRLSALVGDIAALLESQEGSTALRIDVPGWTYVGSVTKVSDEPNGGVSYFGGLHRDRADQSVTVAEPGPDSSQTADFVVDALAIRDLVIFTVSGRQASIDEAENQIRRQLLEYGGTNDDADDIQT